MMMSRRRGGLHTRDQSSVTSVPFIYSVPKLNTSPIVNISLSLSLPLSLSLSLSERMHLHCPFEAYGPSSICKLEKPAVYISHFLISVVAFPGTSQCLRSVCVSCCYRHHVHNLNLTTTSTTGFQEINQIKLPYPRA